jgi:hypothetical protein
LSGETLFLGSEVLFLISKAFFAALSFKTAVYLSNESAKYRYLKTHRWLHLQLIVSVKEISQNKSKFFRFKSLS